MTISRDFDYSRLDTDPPLRDRMHVVASTPRFVIAATLATLMVLIGGTILIALVATGNATDWGGVALLVGVTLGGVYVWYDALRQAGQSSGLDGFAAANDLVLVRGEPAWDYAGSPFRDRERAVEHAVRTRGDDFVEVGECFSLAPVSLRDVPIAQAGALGGVTQPSANVRVPQVYFRVRLAGGSAYPPEEGVHVSPALYDDLFVFLGRHTVEITRHELTVLGSGPLGLDDPDRVREAFRLADALAAENSRDVPSADDGAPTRPAARRRSPWTIVLGTAALIVVVPVLFGVVMGSLVPSEGVPGPGGHAIAIAAVVVLLAITSWAVRFLIVGLRPKRDRKH